MIPAPTTPPVKTPFTDRFEQYTSALEGSAMTQTFWDCAPHLTLFELAWTDEPTARERLKVAALRYVEINERRPLRFYLEMRYHGKATLAGGVVLPDGTYTEAYDHNHFELSTLAAIAVLIGGNTGRRAAALIHAHAQFYIRQPGSYFNLESPSYGATGRCRIARMCINAFRAIMRITEMGGQENKQSAQWLYAHVKNVYDGGRSMRDEPQADGLTIPHWRVFQLALLFAELEEVERVTGADTTPMIDLLRDVIWNSVIRDADDKVIGIAYDVPEPFTPYDPANPWPGAKIGDGKGVEPWLYPYLPDDAKLFVSLANSGLNVAVRAKFGMPVTP